MQGVTIAFINQKGGCGKSSSCFHLAGTLVDLGARVVLVDADPQGSLSQGYFGPAAIESLPAEQTLAAVFDPDRVLPPPHMLRTATAIPNITVMRSNQSLARFNTPTPEATGMRQWSLSSFLDRIRDYDFILIDCPPNLYFCSWSALLAADYVVVPVPPEDFGTQGLRVVHQAITHAQSLNPRLRLLGHLITRADRRLVVHQQYEAQLREIYGSLVMDEVFPEASGFKTALTARLPATQHEPHSRAATAIRRVAVELLLRINQAQEAVREVSHG